MGVDLVGVDFVGVDLVGGHCMGHSSTLEHCSCIAPETEPFTCCIVRVQHSSSSHVSATYEITQRQ